MSKKIVVITNESGDWSGLYVDGTSYYQGHSIPKWVFLDLLSELGVETNEVEETDDFRFPDKLQD